MKETAQFGKTKSTGENGIQKISHKKISTHTKKTPSYRPARVNLKGKTTSKFRLLTNANLRLRLGAESRFEDEVNSKMSSVVGS